MGQASAALTPESLAPLRWAVPRWRVRQRRLRARAGAESKSWAVGLAGAVPLPEPRARQVGAWPRFQTVPGRAGCTAGPGGRCCPPPGLPHRRPSWHGCAQKLSTLSAGLFGPALGRGTGQAGRPGVGGPPAHAGRLLRPACSGLCGSRCHWKACGPTNRDSWGWELGAPWACARPAWPPGGGAPVPVAWVRGWCPQSGAEVDDEPLGWPAGRPRSPVSAPALTGL